MPYHYIPNWHQEKNADKDRDYESVTTTWLPVVEQVEIAKSLGAVEVKHARWLAPEDVDQDKWASRFEREVRAREIHDVWWLAHPEHGMDMRHWLKREYDKDKVNDEFDRDGFFSELADARA